MTIFKIEPHSTLRLQTMHSVSPMLGQETFRQQPIQLGTMQMLAAAQMISTATIRSFTEPCTLTRLTIKDHIPKALTITRRVRFLLCHPIRCLDPTSSPITPTFPLRMLELPNLKISRNYLKSLNPTTLLSRAVSIPPLSLKVSMPRSCLPIPPQPAQVQAFNRTDRCLYYTKS